MTNVTGFTNTQKIKEEAANWLLIIEQESPLSPQKAKALQDWTDTSDVHKAVIMRMSQTWNNMDLLSAMRVSPEQKSRFSIGAIKVLLGDKILRALSKQDNKPATDGYSLFFRFNLVAVCFIASFLVFDFIGNNSDISEPIYYVTEVGEYKNHILDDGSTLWLNSNSKVKVDYSLDFRRIALIEGEAHFKVKKDASRPFEVYSMNRLVRAVGTAFSVHKLEDSVEVMVSEGSVELAIVDEMLVLKPDDLLTYNQGDAQQLEVQNSIQLSHKPAKISKFLGTLSAGDSMSIPVVTSARIEGEDSQVVRLGEGEVGRKLSWLDGKLVFAGESLAEVVTEISRHTTIKIDVPDPELRKIRIGGHFEAGQTDKLFTILESGFGIEVNKINDHHVQLLIKK
jgi:transmembrane sensor